MSTTPIFVPPMELSNSACYTLSKLSKRRATDIALLKSLWINTENFIDSSPGFFLIVPTSQYDRTPNTHRAILRDAGVLLTMPEEVACLMLYQVEGRTHKVTKKGMSEEQWDEVQMVGTKLAIQHPDHVTNVMQLWRKVLAMKNEDVHDMTVKDLGLLWQHGSGEAMSILNELEKRFARSTMEVHCS